MFGKTFIFILTLLFSSQLIIAQKNAKIVHLNGGISATTVFYSAQGIKARKSPFTYILSGNVNLNIYGYNIPLSFVVSDKNSQFRQPFNQFGLSPHYKWVRLHLGYRSIRFSPLVLNGHTIFGAGIELNPGHFRFGVIYGNFKKKINLSRKVDEPFLDTLNTFTRKGYSCKIGVGSRDTYVDLIFLKVADDSLSISSQDWAQTKRPEANAAFGLSSKIKFSEKFKFEMDVAYSLYTKDIFATPFQDEDLHIVNQYLAPVNISSNHFGAYQAGISFRPSKFFHAALKFKRLDPGYKTMGTYYMQNDVQNITLNMDASIWKSKIRITSSLGRESNNLRHLRHTSTQRWIGSANLSFNPNQKFGLSANYSNYSINQTGDVVQIADSVKLYQTNSQWMVNPRYILQGKKISHILVFVYNASQLTDKNPITSAYSGFTLRNYIFNYNINVLKNGLSFSFGYNKAFVKMKTANSRNTSFTLGVAKSFFKQRLHLRFSQMFSKSEQDELKQDVFRPSISGRYKIAKHHNIKFKLYLKSNKSTKSYTETSGDFSYMFTF